MDLLIVKTSAPLRDLKEIRMDRHGEDFVVIMTKQQ